MNRRSWSFSSTARWWACCRFLTPSSSESISLTPARPCGSAPTCGASSIYGESTGLTVVICSHSLTLSTSFFQQRGPSHLVRHWRPPVWDPTDVDGRAELLTSMLNPPCKFPSEPRRINSPLWLSWVGEKPRSAQINTGDGWITAYDLSVYNRVCPKDHWMLVKALRQVQSSLMEE